MQTTALLAFAARAALIRPAHSSPFVRAENERQTHKRGVRVCGSCTIAPDALPIKKILLICVAIVVLHILDRHYRAFPAHFSRKFVSKFKVNETF